jgi:hypothetical protein
MKQFRFLLLATFLSTQALALRSHIKTYDAQTVVGSVGSTVIDARLFEMIHIQAVNDVNTPAAGDFTCAASNICTDAAHGFTTGLKGQASTTDTLPDGLATTTDYFVIALTANTYSLAASYADALAGTAIDILDAGTGTHTFTPTALAGGAIKVQRSSNYNPNTGSGDWIDVTSSSQNVTADGSLDWAYGDLAAGYYRLMPTLTAGRYSMTMTVSKKGSSAQ